MRYQSFDQLFRSSLINLSRNIISRFLVRDSSCAREKANYFFSCRSLPQLYTEGKMSRSTSDGWRVSFSRHLRESRRDGKRPSIESAGNRELILETRFSAVSIFPSTGADLILPLPLLFGKIKKSTPSTPLYLPLCSLPYYARTISLGTYIMASVAEFNQVMIKIDRDRMKSVSFS